MRRSLMVLAAAAVAASSLVMSSGTASADPPGAEAADRLEQMPLKEFLDIKNNKRSEYPQIEWSDDACSAPWYAPEPPDYLADACRRHDFGYRNFGNAFGKSFRPTREQKNLIDRTQLRDMLGICREQNRGAWCVNWATIVFTAVQKGGDDAFFSKTNCDADNTLCMWEDASAAGDMWVKQSARNGMHEIDGWDGDNELSSLHNNTKCTVTLYANDGDEGDKGPTLTVQPGQRIPDLAEKDFDNEAESFEMTNC